MEKIKDDHVHCGTTGIRNVDEVLGRWTYLTTVYLEAKLTNTREQSAIENVPDTCASEIFNPKKLFI